MFFRTTRIFKEAQYLLEKGDILIEQLPRGYGYLANQLRRASTSISSSEYARESKSVRGKGTVGNVSPIRFAV